MTMKNVINENNCRPEHNNNHVNASRLSSQKKRLFPAGSSEPHQVHKKRRMLSSTPISYRSKDSSWEEKSSTTGGSEIYNLTLSARHNSLMLKMFIVNILMDQN